MISEELKTRFAKELSENLNGNILPYWLDNMTDPERGILRQTRRQ